MKNYIVFKLIFISVFFFYHPSWAQLQFFQRSLMGVMKCSTLQSPTPGWNSSNIGGYWNFDGTLGAVANGSTLTAIKGSSATAVSPGGSLTYVTGILSQGIQFNGTSGDYINAGTPASLNDLTAGSVMMWLNPTAATSGTILYKSDNNGSAGWYVYIDYTSPNLTLYFNSVYSSANLKLKTSSINSLAAHWNQIVVTWDGSGTVAGAHIYINSVESSYWFSQASSGTKSSDSAQALYIGKSGSGAAATNYNGKIDEIAIWNRVLTPSEVRSLYLSQKCN